MFPKDKSGGVYKFLLFLVKSSAEPFLDSKWGILMLLLFSL